MFWRPSYHVLEISIIREYGRDNVRSAGGPVQSYYPNYPSGAASGKAWQGRFSPLFWENYHETWMTKMVIDGLFSSKRTGPTREKISSTSLNYPKINNWPRPVSFLILFYPLQKLTAPGEILPEKWYSLLAAPLLALTTPLETLFYGTLNEKKKTRKSLSKHFILNFHSDLTWFLFKSVS